MMPTLDSHMCVNEIGHLFWKAVRVKRSRIKEVS